MQEEIMQDTRNSAEFISTVKDYDAARYVMFGAPMDYTVSFRPGTRMGPQKIREVSFGLEAYSPELDRDLEEVPFFDAGDLILPFGDVTASLALIGKMTASITGDGKVPVMLGGEHLVSQSAIAAVHDRYPDLVVLHFDAHTDLRDEYYGEKNSHACVMRRVAEIVGPQNLYQFGIRSGEREEFVYARSHTHFHPFTVLEPLRGCIEELRGKPIYISLDIDAVDPAFAPGTGTPEPGGCSSSDILESMRLMKGQHVVGFDLVEVSPVYDQSECTSLLAAKIVREFLLACG